MFVDVLVSPDGEHLNELLSRGQPLPYPIWGRGMIDTGTNVSTVSQTILHQLGIPKGISATSQGISGPFSSHFYVVSFSIANKATPGALYSPPDVTVISSAALDIDVLIGLDLLMDCQLFIDGPARRFTLDF